MCDSIREKELLIESLEQQIKDTIDSVESPFDIFDEFTLWQCYMKLDADVKTQMEMEKMYPALAYNVGTERTTSFINIVRSMR